MKLKAAVCDDNRSSLESETALVAEVLNECEIEAEVDSFAAAEELTASPEVYDIVLLDIEMDGMNGMEAARELKRKNSDCVIFFVTNHSAYLDEAFDVHAFRYWRKPLGAQRLRAGLVSAVRELRTRNRLMQVNIKGGSIDVLVKKIAYIYVLNKITHIVTADGEIIAYDSYKEICGRLDELGGFGETRRGCCVNFEHVKGYTADGVTCALGGRQWTLGFSRRKYGEFVRKFMIWIGGYR